MEIEARKLSFEEAWESMSVFFLDDELETEIDQEVDRMLELALSANLTARTSLDVDTVATIITNNPKILEIILMDIGLSEEKFMRIVSLLRRLEEIEGTFDNEWSFEKIKRKLRENIQFAKVISALVIDGKRDNRLFRYIPRYYLDMLNYREIIENSLEARRVRYKHSLIGTYSGRKGHRVEERIKNVILEISRKNGVSFERGRSRFIDTDIDFAIPSLVDPWVIIMSSFQETTSSGQSTKARDMLSAFERIQRSNSRHNEDRAFVNFVDGGGWLARKRDLQRLVANCHYFINFRYLDMIESIVQKHVPEKYLRERS